VEFKRPLPRSSTPNCHWPPGWDFAGERARPGGRFRRRAVVGMARCAVRRPALSSPRRAGGSKFRRPKRGKRQRGHRRAISLPKRRSSTPNCHWPVLAHGHQLGHCWGARPSRLPFSAVRRGRARHSVRAVFVNQNASVDNRRRSED